MSPLDFVPEEDMETIVSAIETVLAGDRVETRQSALVAKDDERVPFEFNATRLVDEDSTVAGFVGTGRNLTERRERERALRQQRDELETLNRINELVREVLRALVGAASREKIEETVCASLAESDLYRFAWVSEYDIVENRLVSRTKAGDDEGYQSLFDEMATTDWERPAATAFRTGEHLVVQDISETALLPERLRIEGNERGLHSGITVPLSYGETTHGVLAVYATRPDAFSEREVAGFDALGELVGFAINAAESKKLLTTASAVELEFEVTDEDAVLVTLSTGRFPRLMASFSTTSTSMERRPNELRRVRRPSLPSTARESFPPTTRLG
ncbi:GAF domain-containing protein [Haladaptatus sp. NG-WS-4]